MSSSSHVAWTDTTWIACCRRSNQSILNLLNHFAQICWQSEAQKNIKSNLTVNNDSQENHGISSAVLSILSDPLIQRRLLGLTPFLHHTSPCPIPDLSSTKIETNPFLDSTVQDAASELSEYLSVSKEIALSLVLARFDELLRNALLSHSSSPQDPPLRLDVRSDSPLTWLRLLFSEVLAIAQAQEILFGLAGHYDTTSTQFEDSQDALRLSEAWEKCKETCQMIHDEYSRASVSYLSPLTYLSSISSPSLVSVLLHHILLIAEKGLDAFSFSSLCKKVLKESPESDETPTLLNALIVRTQASMLRILHVIVSCEGALPFTPLLSGEEILSLLNYLWKCRLRGWEGDLEKERCGKEEKEGDRREGLRNSMKGVLAGAAKQFATAGSLLMLSCMRLSWLWSNRFESLVRGENREERERGENVHPLLANESELLKLESCCELIDGTVGVERGCIALPNPSDVDMNYLFSIPVIAAGCIFYDHDIQRYEGKIMSYFINSQDLPQAIHLVLSESRKEISLLQSINAKALRSLISTFCTLLPVDSLPCSSLLSTITCYIVASDNSVVNDIWGFELFSGIGINFLLDSLLSSLPDHLPQIINLLSSLIPTANIDSLSAFALKKIVALLNSPIPYFKGSLGSLSNQVYAWAHASKLDQDCGFDVYLTEDVGIENMILRSLGIINEDLPLKNDSANMYQSTVKKGVCGVVESGQALHHTTVQRNDSVEYYDEEQHFKKQTPSRSPSLPSSLQPDSASRVQDQISLYDAQGEIKVTWLMKDYYETVSDNSSQPKLLSILWNLFTISISYIRNINRAQSGGMESPLSPEFVQLFECLTTFFSRVSSIPVLRVAIENEIWTEIKTHQQHLSAKIDKALYTSNVCKSFSDMIWSVANIPCLKHLLSVVLHTLTDMLSPVNLTMVTYILSNRTTEMTDYVANEHTDVFISPAYVIPLLLSCSLQSNDVVAFKTTKKAVIRVPSEEISDYTGGKRTRAHLSVTGGGYVGGSGTSSLSFSSLWCLSQAVYKATEKYDKPSRTYPIVRAYLGFIEKLLNAIPITSWCVGWRLLGKYHLMDVLTKSNWNLTSGSKVVLENCIRVFDAVCAASIDNERQIYYPHRSWVGETESQGMSESWKGDLKGILYITYDVLWCRVSSWLMRNNNERLCILLSCLKISCSLLDPLKTVGIPLSAEVEKLVNAPFVLPSEVDIRLEDRKESQKDMNEAVQQNATNSLINSAKQNKMLKENEIAIAEMIFDALSNVSLPSALISFISCRARLFSSNENLLFSNENENKSTVPPTVTVTAPSATAPFTDTTTKPTSSTAASSSGSNSPWMLLLDHPFIDNSGSVVNTILQQHHYQLSDMSKESNASYEGSHTTIDPIGWLKMIREEKYFYLDNNNTYLLKENLVLLSIQTLSQIISLISSPLQSPLYKRLSSHIYELTTTTYEATSSCYTLTSSPFISNIILEYSNMSSIALSIKSNEKTSDSKKNNNVEEEVWSKVSIAVSLYALLLYSSKYERNILHISCNDVFSKLIHFWNSHSGEKYNLSTALASPMTLAIGVCGISSFTCIELMEKLKMDFVENYILRSLTAFDEMQEWSPRKDFFSFMTTLVSLLSYQYDVFDVIDKTTVYPEMIFERLIGVGTSIAEGLATCIINGEMIFDLENFSALKHTLMAMEKLLSGKYTVRIVENFFTKQGSSGQSASENEEEGTLFLLGRIATLVVQQMALLHRDVKGIWNSKIEMMNKVANDNEYFDENDLSNLFNDNSNHSDIFHIFIDNLTCFMILCRIGAIINATYQSFSPFATMSLTAGSSSLSSLSSVSRESTAYKHLLLFLHVLTSHKNTIQTLFFTHQDASVDQDNDIVDISMDDDCIFSHLNSADDEEAGREKKNKRSNNGFIHVNDNFNGVLVPFISPTLFLKQLDFTLLNTFNLRFSWLVSAIERNRRVSRENESSSSPSPILWKREKTSPSFKTTSLLIPSSSITMPEQSHFQILESLINISSGNMAIEPSTRDFSLHLADANMIIGGDKRGDKINTAKGEKRHENKDNKLYETLLHSFTKGGEYSNGNSSWFLRSILLMKENSCYSWGNDFLISNDIFLRTISYITALRCDAEYNPLACKSLHNILQMKIFTSNSMSLFDIQQECTLSWFQLLDSILSDSHMSASLLNQPLSDSLIADIPPVPSSTEGEALSIAQMEANTVKKESLIHYLMMLLSQNYAVSCIKVHDALLIKNLPNYFHICLSQTVGKAIKNHYETLDCLYRQKKEFAPLEEKENLSAELVTAQIKRTHVGNTYKDYLQSVLSLKGGLPSDKGTRDEKLSSGLLTADQYMIGYASCASQILSLSVEIAHYMEEYKNQVVSQIVWNSGGREKEEKGEKEKHILHSNQFGWNCTWVAPLSSGQDVNELSDVICGLTNDYSCKGKEAEEREERRGEEYLPPSFTMPSISNMLVSPSEMYLMISNSAHLTVLVSTLLDGWLHRLSLDVSESEERRRDLREELKTETFLFWRSFLRVLKAAKVLSSLCSDAACASNASLQFESLVFAKLRFLLKGMYISLLGCIDKFLLVYYRIGGGEVEERGEGGVPCPPGVRSMIQDVFLQDIYRWMDHRHIQLPLPFFFISNNQRVLNTYVYQHLLSIQDSSEERQWERKEDEKREERRGEKEDIRRRKFLEGEEKRIKKIKIQEKIKKIISLSDYQTILSILQQFLHIPSLSPLLCKDMEAVLRTMTCYPTQVFLENNQHKHNFYLWSSSLLSSLSPSSTLTSRSALSRKTSHMNCEKHLSLFEYQSWLKTLSFHHQFLRVIVGRPTEKFFYENHQILRQYVTNILQQEFLQQHIQQLFLFITNNHISQQHQSDLIYREGLQFLSLMNVLHIAQREMGLISHYPFLTQLKYFIRTQGNKILLNYYQYDMQVSNGVLGTSSNGLGPVNNWETFILKNNSQSVYYLSFLLVLAKLTQNNQNEITFNHEIHHSL